MESWLCSRQQHTQRIRLAVQVRVIEQRVLKHTISQAKQQWSHVLDLPLSATD